MISKQQFFSHIIPSTLSHEGGYANHKNDKGGETYRGITRKHNPNWNGWAFIDNVKRTGEGLNGVRDWFEDKYNSTKNYVSDKYQNIIGKDPGTHSIPTNTIFPNLENDVKDFYYQKYFVNNRFHQINNVEIAKILFDFAVHGGYSVLKLQKLINKHFPGHGNNGGNVTEDNLIGPETINAVNAIGISLKPYLLQWRQGHLKQIVEHDPSQKVFEQGWKKRLASFGPVQFAKQNKNYLLIGLGVVVMLVVIYFAFMGKNKPQGQPQEDRANV